MLDSPNQRDDLNYNAAINTNPSSELPDLQDFASMVKSLLVKSPTENLDESQT